jgi:hypothetical protein
LSKVVAVGVLAEPPNVPEMLIAGYIDLFISRYTPLDGIRRI